MKRLLLKNPKNISLIGMPAVGKSTVGHLLAAALKHKFIDTDDLIETGHQMTLSQIIHKKGLGEFLNIEKEYIVNLECKKHVIATGGSVIYKKDAMEHLSKISTIIYLQVDYDTLLTRLNNLAARGVAITPGKNILDLYKERTPLYDTWCDIRINCRKMTAKAVSQKALTYLN